MILSMIKESFLWLIALFLFAMNSFSQGNFDATKPTTIIPPSPVAASLFKDIGNSVGYYTGTVQLSVPIWTIKVGSLSLPINLNYSSNGVKVEEEAGIVGLGWSLDAGGAISRSVVGTPDDHTFNNAIGGKIGYQTSATYLQSPDPANDTYPDLVSGWMSNLSSCNVYNMAIGKYELTPDLFYMNFNGHSAKMFSDQNGKFYLSPNKAWQITGSASTSYTVTTEDGVSYNFSNVELTNSHAESGDHDDFNTYSSSWFLTSITSADKADVIQFTYQPVTYFTYNMHDDESKWYHTRNQELSCACQPPDGGYHQTLTHSWQQINGYILQSISTRNQQVVFVTNNNRSDIDDAGGVNAKLDAVKIYSKNAAGLTLIKQYALDYDYFTYNAAPSGSSGNYARLKLTGVKELGANLESGSSYKFEYYDRNDGAKFNLPSKASFAQDSWGYYNGALDNTSLIPAHTDLYGNIIAGADRDPNPQYAGAGLIKRITYPTGGSVLYEYESNDYSEGMGSADDSLKATTHATASSIGINKNASTQFTITFPQYIYISGNLTQHQGCDGNAEIDIKDLSGHNVYNSTSCQPFAPAPFWINPGIYNATSTTTFANETAQIDVQYIQHLYSADMHIKPISGSRINRISYYDNITSSAPSKITRFKYRLNDTLSSGQILNFPQYADYEYTPEPSHVGGGDGKAGDWQYYVMHSTSLIALGRIQGSNTGYSKVTMLHGDNGELGSEVFEYSLDHLKDLGGSGYPYAPTTSLEDLRGLLLEHDIYDAAGTLVESENNNYNDLTFDAYSKNKFLLGIKAGTLRQGLNYDLNGCPAPIGGTGWDLVYNTYRTYQFLPQLLSSTNTQYDANGNSLKAITNYTYDPSTFLVTNQSTTSSKGDVISITNKYPKDFAGTPVYDAMIAKHIISPVIEADQYKNNDILISKLVNDYQVWPDNNDMIVPLDKKLAKGEEGIETRAEFYNYDNYNNLLEQSKTSDVHEVYLWGYNHEYPVAKITGSYYSTVKVIIDQSILDNPTDDNALRIELNKLRTAAALKGALIITYTYAPLIGMTSMTDAAGRTTYYEYDGINRLKIIRDQDNNIVKRFCYNYTGPGTACSTDTYYNTEHSQIFTKDNCGASFQGNDVTYTIPAGTYSSALSQQDADNMATAAITANGQQYANNMGTCQQIFYNADVSQTFTRNNCGVGYTAGTATYAVAYGSYNSIVSQADADALAQADINSNGQAYANTHAECLFICNASTCNGAGKKCIANNGNTNCETGIEIRSGGAQSLGGGHYQCLYHYEWSDGEQSADFPDGPITNAPCTE